MKHVWIQVPQVYLPHQSFSFSQCEIFQPRSQSHAQLFVAGCTEKQRAWYISSREHDVIDKWQHFQNKFNKDATFCVLFNHLHVQRSVSITVSPQQLDTCGMLPGTFVLLDVLRRSTLDVTHVRKCTRPSTFFRAPKAAHRPENEAVTFYSACLPRVLGFFIKNWDYVLQL